VQNEIEQQTEELGYTFAAMRAAFELSNDGILATDRQGRITHFNARLGEMWRMPCDLTASGDLQPVWEFIAQKLQNPAKFLARVCEIEASADEGCDFIELTDRRHFECYTKVLSVEGRMVGRIWNFRDVTERHLIDMNSLRLAAIVDCSDDAIVGKDLDSIITSWNAGAERIFGYSSSEMIGASIMKLIPPERHSEEQEILSRIKRGERLDHFDTVRVAKDGRRLDVSLTVSPIKDSSGNVVGVSKIARDVTERKATEEALREAKEASESANRERQHLLESEQIARSEAEKANRMKDEFLATLSHELRTPLNAVLGWANILRSGRLPFEEMDRGLETIERNARMQAQIIEDLLDMSRIISGKVRLDVQWVDLSNVLHESIDTVQTAAEAKGIHLQSVIDPFVGPISGDPNRLQQVFWNLLNNAIKFTPKDGRVRVVMERADSYVEIRIVDTGEGISPEFLPYVFNRFQQADASTTRRQGGLGLGLAIVRQLVELHGGSVHVKSAGLGQGATFTVKLPVTAIHFDPQKEHRHPGAGSRLETRLPDISLAGVHVLVVDDEPDARQLVKRLLQMAGATVSMADSAFEAMRQILADKPDVLVCDVGMPGEDGYSFIRRLRTLQEEPAREVPAVALTAYARSEDRTKAIRSGFQNHLAKPVEAAELLAIVRSLAAPKSAGASA
jgi:PAS domain S-box-containing protein